jgi:sortase A
MSPPSHSLRAVHSLRTRILRGACYFFLAFGLFALAYAGFVLADSHNYQAAELQKLEQTSDSTEPHRMKEGDVIGEIQVPRLGIGALVVQGESRTTLRHAVGHVPASVLPGEWGNVALAGHRDTFFRPLREIRPGDEITFKTRQRSFQYVVDSTEVVAPTDLRVLAPTTGHDLTLLTCFPFHYVGPAPRRFVVHAREVGSTP